MPNNDELFDEIFVSSNFNTVFCTRNELDDYLNSLMVSGMPRGMSIVFTKKKLNRKYTRFDIMNATPEQIKKITQSSEHLIH
ncbi:MAG TPA: hypothetical protein VKB83_00490 [Nitrosopumilaceae archaeon]|nr:hypothetical protein [Nitrosopumilaceae archaeon]